MASMAAARKARRGVFMVFLLLIVSHGSPPRLFKILIPNGEKVPLTTSGLRLIFGAQSYQE
jgi:hypothetical protein